MVLTSLRAAHAIRKWLSRHPVIAFAMMLGAVGICDLQRTLNAQKI